jgi:DNA-binding response OmpR family regulator
MTGLRNLGYHEPLISKYELSYIRRNMMKIMVADNDRDMVDMLSYWLKGHGYDVVRAFDGEQAIKRCHEALPDLVILDLEMFQRDGFEVCHQMRSEPQAVPLILTGGDCEDDEIWGLEMGADDYLRKPFSPRRLLARIKAVMRRSSNSYGASGSSMITVGPITLNTMRHEVLRGDRKVKVTPTESRLLHLLITHTGQVLTTSIISSRIWGYEEVGTTGLIKTHIRHLRQKVEPDANSPQYILTVPGMGYTFKVPVTPEK